MDEIIIGLITNAPNLAGLMVLAWVLNKQYAGLMKLYEGLLSKYHELVVILAENKQITNQQAQRLIKRSDERDDTNDKNN